MQVPGARGVHGDSCADGDSCTSLDATETRAGRAERALGVLMLLREHGADLEVVGFHGTVAQQLAGQVGVERIVEWVRVAQQQEPLAVGGDA